MKAEAQSLHFLGAKDLISVPFFQRRYVWSESNWEEMLDTFRRDDIMPFLGSIILKEISNKESLIVDGQQRLTTITILAKAIYDSLSDESKQEGSGIKNYIQSYLFFRENAADDFKESKVRIQHSYIDREAYEQVISAGMLNENQIDVDTINDHSGNILRCYKYFRENLNNYSDAMLKALFNSAFDKSRKAFVLIELDRDDINEQTIFDTINRAGIRLSTADIIKNNLYKRLLDKAGESNRDVVPRIYQNNWEKIFTSNQDDSDLWDEERVFGNVKHSNLDFLLYCIACIKWGEAGDMFSNLEAVFERNTSSMGYEDIYKTVVEIKDYALLFKKYILDFKARLDSDESEYFKYNEGVWRLLLILQKFGIQMFYPFVLKRLMETNQDENDPSLLEDFQVLESFVMRRKISNRATNDYTNKCYSILSKGIKSLIESDLSLKDSDLSDTNVRRYLENTKDDAAKMILFWIELYRRKAPSVDVNALEYKYTLEHVMPKHWTSNWSDVSIFDNGVLLDVESPEGQAFRNQKIQAIGNKTLLTGSLNSAIKNSCFSTKVCGIGESKPGYKASASLFITKDIIEAYEQDPVWDESHIDKRTDALYSEFIKLWPFYETVEQDSDSNSQTDDESIVDRFTAEQLSDPVKLLEAIDYAETVDEKDGLISTEELIKSIDVQEETIQRLLRMGEIIPDLTIPKSEHRAISFFKEETVENYIKKFGWVRITDENRKKVFLDMVDEMRMSYSYKPLFLKAIFDECSEEGAVSIEKIVAYFFAFYKERRNSSLIVEKPDSAFAKDNCSYEDAEHTILIYPFKRFADRGMMHYDSTKHTIMVDHSIWRSLTAEEIDLIKKKSDESIRQYYDRIGSNEPNNSNLE